MKVVVSGEVVPDKLRNYCAERGIDLDLLRGEPNAEKLRHAILNADYYLLGGDEKLSKDVLAGAPKLRAVSFVGGGASSFVDLDAADAHGVEVLTTPGANAIAVAEFAVGQALGIRRRIFVNALGEGAITRDTAELSGSKVGILGLGSVGAALGRILRTGFGCDVSYNSRTRKPDLESEIGAHHVELAELFASSSTVFICCTLTESTTGLIGARLLESGVDYIVSIADPRVFALDELAAALSRGSLAGAAMDGDYASAPDVPEDVSTILDEHRKVTLFVTQHIAASSDRAWQRMQDRAVDNLIGAIETGDQ